MVNWWSGRSTTAHVVLDPCSLIWMFGDSTIVQGHHFTASYCVLKCSISAFHPSGVDKLSTSFSWGYGGNVASVGWQVTLCGPVCRASSRSACDYRTRSGPWMLSTEHGSTWTSTSQRRRWRFTNDITLSVWDQRVARERINWWVGRKLHWQ